ncbi:MAG: hypothetical protein QOJ46_2493 [bacterium]|jgi:hypothetical protein
MKRKLAGAAATLLTVAGLAVAGCGSDDNKASTTTTPGGAGLTKAQYIAAADKICKATSDKLVVAATKLRKSADKTGTIPIPKVTRFLTQTSLPAYEGMLAELRALAAPKQDEKTIDGIIAALAGAIDTAKAQTEKVAKNQVDPFDDANARAVAYGMKVCGS